MERAFVIKTKKGIETYIGTLSKIKTYTKEFEILEEMSIDKWRVLELLQFIKMQTGLELKLCDTFFGIKDHAGKKYFNVILKDRTSESKEYDILQRFADKYKKISVEPNGLKRVAIFF